MGVERDKRPEDTGLGVGRGRRRLTNQSNVLAGQSLTLLALHIPNRLLCSGGCQEGPSGCRGRLLVMLGVGAEQIRFASRKHCSV